MRLKKIAFLLSFCFIAIYSFAQNSEGYTGKYRPFSIYVGAGPSVFINNLVVSKNDVNAFQYAFSARFMWEPRNSFVSLGIETGYYKLYTVNSTYPKAEVANSAIPILFDVSMKFGKQFYGNFSMGQSVTKSKVTNTDSAYDFNSSTWSFSDFSASVGYRFKQKERISYAVELKGFYSSSAQNATIALLFIVGFKL
jgi:hypothetical protein